MNRAFVPLLKSMFVAILAVSSATQVAHASDAKPAPKADPAKGEALYSNGDASRNITACVACHGAAGNSTIAQNPRLAGQFDSYISKQLHDFKTPQRNNPVMTAIAKALNDDDIRNIAAYLDKQEPKQGAAKNKDTVEFGKKIYRAGIGEKNVPACAGCHGASGNGIPAQFPRLAGQHQDYTVAQLTSFRAGGRKNSAQMTTISKRLSDDEMQAVADYVAGLK
ncbi:c-type cytochrome [Noviherbaspirillum galbum]|uniref:Cytochrome c4 n=1 Tax=Noviherbaspirillum galbum TaxID=2709383 RepID=A0A6B3SL48_9BURK|nr:c-type cytochrome [Noviherbaspirillum galbum]NEX61477.1 cytochrome c4 [Noviherbaspirillum galbum]